MSEQTEVIEAVEKDAACTCEVYVVDYSDPERYHAENLDREDDPDCPFHGPSDRAKRPGAALSRTVEANCCPGGWADGHAYWCANLPTPPTTDRAADGRGGSDDE